MGDFKLIPQVVEVEFVVKAFLTSKPFDVK
jgi:hypothetical protein